MVRFTWHGYVVGVNKWTQARVMRIGHRSIPQIYETSEYRSFKDSLCLAVPRKICFDGYVNVKIEATLYKMRDTDNIIKPVLDALQMSGIISNDRYVKDIHVTRFYHGRDDEDELTIEIEAA